MLEVKIEEKELNSKLSKEFHVSFSHSILRETVSRKIKAKQKSAKLPGFREGQVPFFIVEKKYKDSALSEAIKEKAEAVVEEIVAPYKNNLVGRADIRNFKSSEENGVSFAVVFELFPQFEMPDFQKIEIEHYTIEVPKEEIEGYLNLIVKDRRQFDQNFDGKNAKTGDLLVIDFESRIDGEIHKNGSATDMSFELGSGALLKDFEDKLVSCSKGEELEFNITFPADYNLAPEIAGKTSKVNVRVKDVKRYEPAPAIDDELASKYGCKDLSELRYRVGEIIRNAIYKDAFLVNKMKLFDQLEHMLSFEVPEGLFKKEMQGLLDNAELKQHLSFSDEEYKSYCEKLALRKLRIGIMISDYARLNGIKVDEKEFQRHVLSQVEKYPDQRAEIIEYYKNNASSWYSSSLEEKSVRQIISERVSLIDVEKTSSEIRQIIEEFQKVGARR
jgi:trigger factor